MIMRSMRKQSKQQTEAARAQQQAVTALTEQHNAPQSEMTELRESSVAQRKSHRAQVAALKREVEAHMSQLQHD